MPCPKHESKGIDFSPDGSLMAAVLKQEGDVITDGQVDRSDVIGLFNVRNTGEWECLYRFSSGSAEVEDLHFSRDGNHLIVWDSPLQCSI